MHLLSHFQKIFVTLSFPQVCPFANSVRFSPTSQLSHRIVEYTSSQKIHSFSFKKWGEWTTFLTGKTIFCLLDLPWWPCCCSAATIGHVSGIEHAGLEISSQSSNARHLNLCDQNIKYAPQTNGSLWHQCL